MGNKGPKTMDDVELESTQNLQLGLESHGLNILSQNLRSINQNFRHLETLMTLTKSKFGVLAVQEIWNSLDDRAYTLDGYQIPILRKRQQNRGGGVGFWVKKGIIYNEVNCDNSFEDGVYESLTISVTVGQAKYIIINIYRPPNSSLQGFFQHIDAHLTEVSNLVLI
jgi:hypothetical protein